MKKHLIKSAENAKKILNQIKHSHRIALLDEEVVNIRAYLSSVLKKNPSVRNVESCKEFWEAGPSNGRAIARDVARIKRSEIIQEMGSMLREIEDLTFSQLVKIASEIDQDIRDCLTELHSSRKKKPKIDRNETSETLEPFPSSEDMVKMPSDFPGHSKKDDKPKYHSGRSPRRNIAGSR
jgi:hypothetical protein